MFWLFEQKMVKVKKIVPMQAMEAYVIMQVQLHEFLTSALDGGEWRTSHPCHFILDKKKPWYEAWWAQEPDVTVCQREQPLTRTRNLSWL
jgi:hypothetical protein